MAQSNVVGPEWQPLSQLVHQITGRLLVAGICDEPRITEQIEATAKQFPTVKRVRVFVSGSPLKEAIS